MTGDGSARLAALSAPSLTKAAAAFTALRAAIEDGRLRPGDRLRIDQLARDLQMSSTPIREALRLLQAEGLVDYEEHRGLSVRSFPAEAVDEIYRLRTVLEPMAVQLAVERASEAERLDLKRIHHALKQMVQPGLRGPEASRLNSEWHRSLYSASGSAILVDFISRLWSRIPVELLWTSDHVQTSVENHEVVMRALEARDSDAAAEAMADHIRGSHRRNLSRIARRP